MKTRTSTAFLTLLLAGGLAQAASWDEGVHGDLSNDRLSPTALSLGPGSNPVQGNFGSPDLDYLAVTVPAGHVLSAMTVGAGNVIGGVRSFLAVQAGPVMTVAPDTQTADGLLGAMHYQDATVGTNLLPDLGQGGLGAAGFAGALPAGSYTFWIQDTSSEPGLRYSFAFEVSPVPEPATAALLLAGIGLVGSVTRRKSLNPTA